MATTATAFEPLTAEDTIAALESRLRSLHQAMVTNQYEAGAILTDLKKQFNHGQWGVYLRQLCNRLNLSQRAAHYYMETYAELQGHEGIVQAAKDAGLNTNKKPVRTALVEARKEQPAASPVEIANFAKLKVSKPREFKNPAINELDGLRKRYSDMKNVRIERVGGADTNEVVPAGTEVAIHTFEDGSMIVVAGYRVFDKDGYALKDESAVAAGK
jgi:hypothetical protein